MKDIFLMFKSPMYNVFAIFETVPLNKLLCRIPFSVECQNLERPSFIVGYPGIRRLLASRHTFSGPVRSTEQSSTVFISHCLTAYRHFMNSVLNISMPFHITTSLNGWHTILIFIPTPIGKLL